MQIANPNPNILGQFCEHSRNCGKRTIDRTHKHTTQETDHGDSDSIPGFDNAMVASRCRDRKVGWLDDVRFGCQYGRNLLFALDMVAERYGVNACGNEFVVL